MSGFVRAEFVKYSRDGAYSRSIGQVLGVRWFSAVAETSYGMCQSWAGFDCGSADGRWKIALLSGAGGDYAGAYRGRLAVDFLNEGPG
ncbi:hypothetical protein ES703_104109 [subsurface metagenome]